jgi:hypothetical protein
MKLFRYRKLAFGRAIRLTGHQPRNMERSDRRAEMRLFRMLRWKWRGLPRQVVQVPLKYALEEVSNSSGLWTHLESDDLGDSWPPKFPRKRRRSVSWNMHSSLGFAISTQLLPNVFSEARLGGFLCRLTREQRKKVVIATKFGEMLGRGSAG